MWLVMLVVPDRAILDPLPALLADKYCLRPDDRLPWSNGIVLDAREGSYWAHCPLTEWCWDPDYWWEMDEGAFVLPFLPELKIGHRMKQRKRKGVA